MLMNRNISVLVYDITLGNRRSGITIQRLYLGLNVNVTYVTAGSRSGQIPRFVLAPVLKIIYRSTDVQNAAYEVFEGAKKQDLDWNPEENGGFAAQGTTSLENMTMSVADRQIRMLLLRLIPLSIPSRISRKR
jgi:hypothetical protein